MEAGEACHTQHAVGAGCARAYAAHLGGTKALGEARGAHIFCSCVRPVGVAGMQSALQYQFMACRSTEGCNKEIDAARTGQLAGRMDADGAKRALFQSEVQEGGAC